MEPELGRGDEILEGIRIVKAICNENNYALYKVEGTRYALYIDSSIADYWKHNNWLPKSFIDENFKPAFNGYCYLSDKGYKIFTALKGPYPEDTEEIEEFACLFKAFTDKFAQSSFPNLAFIEKIGIMLPLPNGEEAMVSAGMLFGNWITSGVSVDICDSQEKVITFCDWLTEDEVVKYTEMAGLQPASTSKTDEKIEKEKVIEEDPSLKYEKNFILPGREKLTKFFNDQIIDFLKHREAYSKMGISTMPAVLLYGKPGSGKTFAVEQLAKYLQLPYFEINAQSVASPYIHDTSKKISEVFQKAISQAPSILVIDEIEAYVGQRSSNSQSFKVEEVDEFLRNIPKAIDALVIVFGMTNHLEMIDSAMLRKGRFDEIIEVEMPNKEVKAVLTDKFGHLPVASDIDIVKYATQLAGHPMSDVAFVVREAGRMAVRNRSNVITDEIISQVINKISSMSNQSTNQRRIGF